MQINQLSPCHTVESMVRALRTGNYSVVIGWLADDLTEEEHAELVDAANEGNAMGVYYASGKRFLSRNETTFRAKNSL